LVPTITGAAFRGLDATSPAAAPPPTPAPSPASSSAFAFASLTFRFSSCVSPEVHLGNNNTVYTPSSGVPAFPSSRSANSGSPLKRHDLYGNQQLRRRFRPLLPAIFRAKALRLKACTLYYKTDNGPSCSPVPHPRV